MPSAHPRVSWPTCYAAVCPEPDRIRPGRVTFSYTRSEPPRRHAAAPGARGRGRRPPDTATRTPPCSGIAPGALRRIRIRGATVTP
ncbi:hypothetical protein Y09_1493 [Brachybacterium sp. SW0106-09]|nr:hypothetical protein Y09_1493 [Brachybacterium sp. SW0106-09]